jgi:hypothetical protein
VGDDGRLNFEYLRDLGGVHLPLCKGTFGASHQRFQLPYVSRELDEVHGPSDAAFDVRAVTVNDVLLLFARDQNHHG